MRHFLQLPTAIGRLAVGMVAPAQAGALMPGPGQPLTLQSSLLAAPSVAVDLVMLAAAADQRQLPAASTAVAAQRRPLYRLPPRLRTGRRPIPSPVAGCRSETHGCPWEDSQRLGRFGRLARVAAFPTAAVAQARAPGTGRGRRPRARVSDGLYRPEGVLDGGPIQAADRAGTSCSTTNAGHAPFAALGGTS
jgi:hypothetical protein